MRAPVKVVFLALGIAGGSQAASAQYTPPTIYAPPRTFQHTQPQNNQDREAWVTVPGSGRWDRGRGGELGRDVEVTVPIPLDGQRPQSQAELTKQIVGEFSECLAYGTDLILDCLRQNHDSVTIRKLQACLRSDIIPQDPAEVQACLAAGNW
jgi:hypothetical protein